MRRNFKPGTKVVFRGDKREYLFSHSNKEGNVATLIARDDKGYRRNLDVDVALLEPAPKKGTRTRKINVSRPSPKAAS